MKKTILICDSELGIRASLNQILSDKYNVSLAKDSKECLEYFKKKSPAELAIINISEAGIFKRIKGKTKVIILTNYRSADKAIEMIKGGASDFIVKPFNSSDVLEKVERALV